MNTPKEDRDLLELALKAVGHLTQEEAAGVLGVSQKTVSDWRGGARPKLSPKRRRSLLKVLEVGVAGEPGEMKPPPGVEPGSDLEAEWLAALRDIRRSGGTARQQMFALDALAGVIGRIAWARGEIAAEERARAVRSGDEAGKARAESVARAALAHANNIPDPRKVPKRGVGGA